MIPPQDGINNIYADRNRVVQLAADLARLLGMKAGVGYDPAEPDWPVIFIDLPRDCDGRSQQVSWHVPKEELLLSTPYDGVWDGHDNSEKAERIKNFITDQDKG